MTALATSPRFRLALLLVAGCQSPTSTAQPAKHLISWGSTNYGLGSLPASPTEVAQLAAGGSHALLLTAQGTVLAWGETMSGQSEVPADLGVVRAVAAGGNHSLALLESGAVRAWGDNTYGQCTVPANLRATAIAGGGAFSAAIRTDGTLEVWGYTAANPPVPTEFTNLIRIAAGEMHVIAQRNDGQILVWGGHPPMPVPEAATNVTALAAGSVHNLVLRADGVVIAWGVDSHGQVQVPPDLTEVVAVAAGGYRSAIVRRDGSVVEWGDTQWFPMPGGVTQVSHLALGGIHTVAFGAQKPWVTVQPLSQPALSGHPVTFEGTVSGTPPLSFQWQYEATDLPGATEAVLTLPAVERTDSGAYRLVVRNGLGTAISADAVLTVSDAPPTIPNQSGTVTTFRGGEAVLGVGVQGSLPFSFQWRKDDMDLPNETNSSLQLTPVPADAAGSYSVEVRNLFGVVTSAPIQVHLLPVARWGSAPLELVELPLAMTNAVAVSVRDWESRTGLGLLSDGRVVTWGGSLLLRWGASNLTDIVAISAGGSGFGMALQANGRVTVWGANNARQTNTPPGLSEVVGIAAGWRHCLALRRDGTVVGWGENAQRQATPPADLHSVVGIGAGFTHSVALRSDGTAVAWGNNIVGQLDVPPDLHSLIAIAAGADHTLGLKADGTVVAWGQNSGGQTEVPAGLTDVVAVAADDTYSLALRRDGALVLWGRAGAVTNLPPKLEGVQAICADSRIAYALLGNGTPTSFAAAANPVRNAEGFTVEFAGERGSAYRLEFADQLPSFHWNLGIPALGEDQGATLRDPTATGPARFYRIRRLR